MSRIEDARQQLADEVAAKIFTVTLSSGGTREDAVETLAAIVTAFAVIAVYGGEDAGLLDDVSRLAACRIESERRQRASYGERN
jgi:hypothetical protein